jgi:hypothetical protein
MAVEIVHLLEPIDVEHDQGELALVTQVASHFAPHHLHQCTPIQHLRERIGDGEPVQLLVRRAQLRRAFGDPGLQLTRIRAQLRQQRRQSERRDRHEEDQHLRLEHRFADRQLAERLPAVLGREQHHLSERDDDEGRHSRR